MKKYLVPLFLAYLLLICMGLPASGETSGDYEYTLDINGDAVITGYTGRERELRVPDRLGGHTVVAVGEKAFVESGSYGGNEYLSSLTLPEGITSIGDYACKKVTTRQ